MIAYFAFGETIDALTWVGALVIFASAVYITRREAQLRRAASMAAGQPLKVASVPPSRSRDRPEIVWLDVRHKREEWCDKRATYDKTGSASDSYRVP